LNWANLNRVKAKVLDLWLAGIRVFFFCLGLLLDLADVTQALSATTMTPHFLLLSLHERTTEVSSLRGVLRVAWACGSSLTSAAAAGWLSLSLSLSRDRTRAVTVSGFWVLGEMSEGDGRDGV